MNMVVGLAAVAAAAVAVGLLRDGMNSTDGYDVAARSQMTWHQAATTAALNVGVTSGQVPANQVVTPAYYVPVEPWITVVASGATVTLQPSGSVRTPLMLAEALSGASDGDYGAGMVRGGWFWSATRGQMFQVPGVAGPVAAYATVLP